MRQRNDLDFGRIGDGADGFVSRKFRRTRRNGNGETVRDRCLPENAGAKRRTPRDPSPEIGISGAPRGPPRPEARGPAVEKYAGGALRPGLDAAESQGTVFAAGERAIAREGAFRTSSDRSRRRSRGGSYRNFHPSAVRPARAKIKSPAEPVVFCPENGTNKTGEAPVCASPVKNAGERRVTSPRGSPPRGPAEVPLFRLRRADA